ncbi:MAG: hypothetical protein AAFZ07_08230 [Actinomycetota bacterium]
MDTDPTPDPTTPSRSLVVAIAGAVAAVVVVAVGFLVLRSDDGDTVEAAESPETTVTSAAPTTDAPPTTPASTTSTTSIPLADPPPPSDANLELWVGTYAWTEVAEASGSELSVVHELTLDAVTNSGRALTGGFTQTGESVETNLRVRANPNADGTGIAVELIEIDRGKGIEVPGDVLFELTGDPAEPTTVLLDLVTLRIDHPAEGTYFVPATGDVPATDDEATALPTSFWAIEDETYDLVSVDSTSGEVLRRVAGWGPLSDDPDVLGQALVGVDAAASGLAWVSDCCEPAAGGLFAIGPDTAGIDAPLATALGVWPELSPDGSRVAMGVLEEGVQVSDATTGEVVIGAERTGPILSRPTDVPGFPQPLGWIDDNVVAVSITDHDALESTITLFTTAGEPTWAGEVSVAGIVRDGTAADGLLWLLVSPRLEDRSAVLVTFDWIEGELIREVDIPDGTIAIDADPTGSHLLELTDEGDAAVSTASGERIPLPGAYLDVSW